MKLALPVAALLGAFLPHLAMAQVAILHIQIVEGEGAVNTAGSRSSRPLVVEVTDETGSPVADAAVSFHLPEEGPGGTFSNGLRTDVILSDARGRAGVRTMQLNRNAGRFPIRVLASKEQAHAGMVTFQYIVDAKSAAGIASKSKPSVTRGPLKWIVIAAIAGGAAAAGALAAGRSSNPASSPSPAATGPTVSIGNPTLTIGKP